MNPKVLSLLSLFGLLFWASLCWLPTLRPYTELWLCESQTLKDPFKKTINLKFQEGEGLEKEAKKAIKSLNLWPWHIKIDRRFLSSIIYVEAQNVETVNRLTETLKQNQEKIKFQRILGRYETNLEKIAIKKISVGVAITTVLILCIYWKNQYKLSLLTTIFVVSTILVNGYNKNSSLKQNERNVEIKNDISPKGSSYGHNHALNIIKQHTGEIAQRILEEKYKTSFKINKAKLKYQPQPSKTYSHYIWVRSTATPKEINAAVKAAEKLSNLNIKVYGNDNIINIHLNDLTQSDSFDWGSKENLGLKEVGTEKPLLNEY